MVSLTACAEPARPPEERARSIADEWVAASSDGDEDSAQGLACGGAMLGSVNSDTAGFESYTLDIDSVGDGDFAVTVTKSYRDYPDLVSNLMVRTDDTTCIAWVR
ncbi:hypothetical protein [Microbacterium phyllosphaerae]|uniref:hypothetical protein n=1 Tax=Microbacterium phyllosphaerae TaxID=124798 RepID=UPI0011AE34A0|nr:hypothetical protein [Microbacterium phyllosphaerae]